MLMVTILNQSVENTVVAFVREANIRIWSFEKNYDDNL